MTLTLALLIAALIVWVTAWGTLFAIGLVAAPRGIVSGPAVTLARVLFVIGCIALLAAVVLLIVGVVTSWA